MNAHTISEETQFLEMQGVKMAVMPYENYLELKKIYILNQNDKDNATIPHEVIKLELEHDSLVKAWRLHLGISQKELAQKLNISPAGLSQIEKPGSNPQRKTLEKVASALGISVEQIEE